MGRIDEFHDGHTFPTRAGWVGGHAKAKQVYGRVGDGPVMRFPSIADAHHHHEGSYGMRHGAERGAYPGDMHLYPADQHPDKGGQPSHVIKKAGGGQAGYTLRHKLVDGKPGPGARPPRRRHYGNLDSRG